MKYELLTPVSCAGLTHRETDVTGLEEFRFADEEAFLQEAREHFKGVVLLQTCNRVEIYVQGDSETLQHFLEEKGKKNFWTLEGCACLNHLLHLSAGIDSMIVGEDQILGQLKKALSLSQASGVCSPVLDLCINKAVHAGIEVRKRTNINNGAVSIGSAAVELAEELLGSLDGSHILVVGGGEIGKLVAQALAAKKLTAIYVTNRTFETAKTLAEEIGGKAVMLDELYRYISLSDVVISCTAAPHPIIHAKPIAETIKNRVWPLDKKPKPLILIDIAQPRDIEDSVRTIEGVRVFTIDDLKNVSEKNLISRRHEAELAEKFLLEEEKKFVSLINRASANEALADLHTWAEAIRIRERDRALSRLSGSEIKTNEIVDDFSRVLVKKLLTDATFAIRSCAEIGDMNTAEKIVLAITRGKRPCSPKEDLED
ncbi:glutamyl-tRNA reductase [Methanoplanus sp. FWC-SCC4]|uniref:Glutamyl-tRNA reductase n=1 Tax=Methanochimaera problematica TaxID=2609417 RepID=A0AA97FD75_9EURY|nr:glutamyl-tRNA reductase [Methanoplanus sp. FWC-SCC4]WOF15893.1 glutamyl-tRNA reductase [Methanoplanus sp. FWC-SCC4]